MWVGEFITAWIRTQSSRSCKVFPENIAHEYIKFQDQVIPNSFPIQKQSKNYCTFHPDGHHDTTIFQVDGIV